MKRTVLSVLALSGALVLGACGSDTSPTAAPASASKPAASPSASAAPAGPEVGDEVPLADIAKASAAAVEEKGTAHLTMSASGSGETEADLDLSGSSPTMSMTISEQGETIEMVYVDKVMYMGGDSFAEMTGGKRWIKIDPEGDDMMSQMVGPLLGQIESSMGNPAEQLEAYADATATVKAIEDGVTTYEVTLTKKQLAAVLKKQPEALPGVTEQALKDIPAEGITYTMSLDADSLPVTLAMDLAGESVELTYSDWGKDVAIEAPKASEVGTFELPDLG